MNSPNLTAFLEGREEIMLWPTAVAAYYLTLHDSLLAAALFGASIFSGAISYTFYKKVRQIVESTKDHYSRKNRHSRGNETDEDVYEDIFESVGDLFPSHVVALWATIIGWIIEILLFILAFFWLLYLIAVSYPPSITEIGLISLPLMSGAVIISNILWNS